MNRYNPMILSDFYKQNHFRMYVEGMVKLYSGFTPRKSRFSNIDQVVVFGIQYWILEYLIKGWNEGFFRVPERIDGNTVKFASGDPQASNPEQYFKDFNDRLKAEVINDFSRLMKNTAGEIDTLHWERLWDLGYMPLEIKALPEGTLCPIGVPCVTITNTHPAFAWLVNFLETIFSTSVWQGITSATLAYQFRLLLNKHALKTTGSTEGVQFQGHDFSMRGMSSLESACISGAAHLLSFVGTDTIPAISFLEEYYSADVEKELVGTSVPATEHSVMCMGTKDDEIGTFKDLLDKFPEGILSVVSDTWDLWKVLTEYLPKLKDQILARKGKLVIRPDSGDPVDIICGNNQEEYLSVEGGEAPYKGVIELLWETFGGTVNELGYKMLDSHIGAIYGDSINLERAEAICSRLEAKGFASTNIVFGVGSYTYQYNTRDTFGFAMKATYGEVLTCDVKCKQDYDTYKKTCMLGNHQCKEAREIFKDPITDDGTKKSKKGLMQVYLNKTTDRLEVRDQVSWEEEKDSYLETVFLNGKLVKTYSLADVRERLHPSN